MPLPPGSPRTAAVLREKCAATIGAASAQRREARRARLGPTGVARKAGTGVRRQHLMGHGATGAAVEWSVLLLLPQRVACGSLAGHESSACCEVDCSLYPLSGRICRPDPPSAPFSEAVIRHNSSQWE